MGPDLATVYAVAMLALLLVGSIVWWRLGVQEERERQRAGESERPRTDG